MTLVSIVTPSYNQEPFLEQTIRSVLEQDHAPIEYFVMDGGSTDGSLEIIEKYAPRLAGWVSEPDRGQADAINKGLARARGEIVAWLNSDDYYLPGALTAAVRCFDQHPEAVLVYADMLAVDERGRTINRLHYRQLGLEDLLCFNIIGQPAVFMRRSALEGAGGLDPTFHFLLDHQLWIRLAQRGPMMHANETWAAARYHAAAKNRARAAEFGAEALRIYEWAKSDPALAQVVARLGRRGRASVHRFNARYLLDGGQPRAALVAWWRALLLYPPAALERMNLLAAALLELAGLGRIRDRLLAARQRKFERPGN